MSHPPAPANAASVREDLHRKLFIGGLAWTVGTEQLRQHFSQFGELIDCNLPRCPKTGRPRGFAFLTYKEREQVDNAQYNRPHVLDGRQVETRRAMPKEEADTPEASVATKKLFVGGLRREAVDRDLRDYFTPYGTIVDAYIVKDPKGESRGFGFVLFDDSDAVDKVMLYRPHRILDGQADVRRGLNKGELATVQMRHHQGPGPWGPMPAPPQAPLQLGSYPNQWRPPGPAPMQRRGGGFGGGPGPNQRPGPYPPLQVLQQQLNRLRQRNF